MPPRLRKLIGTVLIIILVLFYALVATTVASATGLTLAARGLKTLVLSVDAAHSLADAFDLDGRLADKRRGVPVAVAELSTVPASISACVIVCVPVQVVLAPGASVVTGQTAAASS